MKKLKEKPGQADQPSLSEEQLACHDTSFDSLIRYELCKDIIARIVRKHVHHEEMGDVYSRYEQIIDGFCCSLPCVSESFEKEKKKRSRKLRKAARDLADAKLIVIRGRIGRVSTDAHHHATRKLHAYVRQRWPKGRVVECLDKASVARFSREDEKSEKCLAAAQEEYFAAALSKKYESSLSVKLKQHCRSDESLDQVIEEIEHEIRGYSFTRVRGESAARVNIRGNSFPEELANLLAQEWVLDSKALIQLLRDAFKRWRKIDDPKSTYRFQINIHQLAPVTGHDRKRIERHLEQIGVVDAKDKSVRSRIGKEVSRGQSQKRNFAVCER